MIRQQAKEAFSNAFLYNFIKKNSYDKAKADSPSASSC